jgi:hypothetical protein
MNVRVTVPGRGYRKHSAAATTLLVDRTIVIHLGDGSTVEIFPRFADAEPAGPHGGARSKRGAS